MSGRYTNNCICHESGGHIGHSNDSWVNLSYVGDVEQLVDNNFKGIKVDNCGASEQIGSFVFCLDRWCDVQGDVDVCRTSQRHGPVCRADE